MLKWIGGGKPDHPMADAKQAKDIVADLPANDAMKALDEVNYWLESLHNTEGFKLDRLFENIDLLDGAAKNHQRKLSQDYLAMSRQQKFQENRLWTAVYEFWRQLGASYLLCVERYESGASGATAIRKSLPLIVARALRALTLQLKWMLLRYGPVEDRIWTEIARLYRFAEDGGFATGTTMIYPGSHGAGTVRQEFLKAMMLSVSSTDSMTPVKLEIAEHAVAHFAPSFTLAREPDAACHFYFDLGAGQAPARTLKGVEPGPTVRYFGAGAALAGLNQLVGFVAETGGIPQDVNLGGSYEKDVVLTVLRHLAQYWSDQPPARSSERRRTTARITVVPGMAEVLNRLDPAHSDSLDFHQESAAESWVVENVSDGGYGAIVPTVKSDWLKVGAVIGVQPESSPYWGVGILRRISRDEKQQRRVGIQLLSKTVIPIKLARPATTSSPVAPREPEGAILLSTSPDSRGEVGVLMREGTYNARDSLEMAVKGKSFLLMPAKIVEDGEDYDYARFKVLQRAG